MNTSIIEMVEQLQAHAGVMPWLGDACDMLERQNTRINQLTAAVDEALAAIGSMQVLEAGASYGVRLPLGEIEKVQAILKAVQPGV